MAEFKRIRMIVPTRQLLRFTDSSWNPDNPVLRIVDENGDQNPMRAIVLIFEDMNISQSHMGRGKWRRCIYEPRILEYQHWNWTGTHSQLIVPEES